MASNLASLIRNLQQRKGRKRQGLTVAEGVRLVEEALDADVVFRGALVGESLGETARGSALLRTLASHAVPLEQVPDRTLRDLAETETPQGVVAIIDPPRFELGAVRPEPGSAVLVLDGVQDPGNVGGLLRTALAMGAPGAILLSGTADPRNPKVIRSAMGASFRLPAAHTTVNGLGKWVTDHDAQLWIADADGMSIKKLAAPDRLAVVVGNEGAGVRQAVRDLAIRHIAIPLAQGAESLNVTVAAGIILYEVQRGR
jgi:TrmH family RNA methyltransferase